MTIKGCFNTKDNKGGAEEEDEVQEDIKDINIEIHDKKVVVVIKQVIKMEII